MEKEIYELRGITDELLSLVQEHERTIIKLLDRIEELEEIIRKR